MFIFNTNTGRERRKSYAKDAKKKVKNTNVESFTNCKECLSSTKQTFGIFSRFSRNYRVFRVPDVCLLPLSVSKAKRQASLGGHAVQRLTG